MNNLQNNLPPELFSPEEIVQVIFGFEKLIGQKQASLNFPRGSQIDKAGLAAIEMLDKFKRKIPTISQKVKARNGVKPLPLLCGTLGGVSWILCQNWNGGSISNG